MTPEQKEAEENLVRAIKEMIYAYSDPDDPHWVLTDYVVLTTQTQLDGKSGYCRFYMGDEMPWYRILGLIEVHRKLIDRQFSEEGLD